jgi:NaMN:DMB phosphoribosyltransferase
MTLDEANAALAAGAARVRQHAALGTNVIGFGEMGIANTSSAACLMSRLLDVPIDACVGRGTGLDDQGSPTSARCSAARSRGMRMRSRRSTCSPRSAASKSR